MLTVLHMSAYQEVYHKRELHSHSQTLHSPTLSLCSHFIALVNVIASLCEADLV